MISVYNNRITLDQDKQVISFSKDRWFPHELRLATCIGLGLSEDKKKIVANLERVSRKALYEFIKKSYANLSKSKNYKTDREILYAGLKESYAEIYSSFDARLRELPFYSELYNHQKEGVFLCSKRQHNLLSFEQGLGKSITSISVSMINNYRKTLVITPAICKWNWYAELQKWGVDKSTVSVVDSKKTVNYDTHERWVLINFEMLKKHMDKILKRKIDHIIIDEAHYIKNPSSNRYGFVKEIANHTGAKITLLTGTPIKNRVNDLYAYMNLTGQPLGRSYRSFILEFTYNHSTPWGKSVSRGKHLDILHSLISNFLIRRTKKECIDLPSKISKKYYFEMKDYKSEYKKSIAEFLTKNAEGGSGLNNSIHTINMITTLSKLSSIINLTEDLIYQGKKIVIFTSYTEPLNRLVDAFYGRCVHIDGRVDVSKRQGLIEKFHEDEDCPVFIGNIAAAGVGINLNNATEVIFCNLPFTSAELDQAVDRLHRIGQDNQVNVYYTICKDTTDEVIYDMIVSKSEDIKNSIDTYKETTDLSNLPNELFSTLTKNKS